MKTFTKYPIIITTLFIAVFSFSVKSFAQTPCTPQDTSILYRAINVAPYGLALHGNKIVVTQHGWGAYGAVEQVQIWNQQFQFTFGIVPPDDTFSLVSPEGAAFDALGNLYITQTERPDSNIMIYDTLNSYIGVIDNSSGDAHWTQPRSIAFDASGSLYVISQDSVIGVTSPFTDVPNTGKLIKIADPLGTATKTVLLTGLRNPKAVAISGNDLYISEYAAGMVCRYNLSSMVKVDSVTVPLPMDLHTTGCKLYCTEHGTNTVQVFDADSLFMGAIQQFRSFDTTHGPLGILLNAVEDIYICDNDSSQVISFPYVTPVIDTITDTLNGHLFICLPFSGFLVLDSFAHEGHWISTDTDIIHVIDSVVVAGDTMGYAVALTAGLDTLIHIYTGGSDTFYMALSGVGPIPPTPGPLYIALETGNIYNEDTMCIHNVLQLIDDVPGGYWSTSNSGVAEIRSDGTVWAKSVGTAVISYQFLSACQPTTFASFTIHVRGANAGQITGPSTVCKDDSIALSETVSNGQWYTNNNSVASIDNNGTLTGLAPGNILIKYIVTDLVCGSAIVYKNVTVKPRPDAGVITGADSVCQNDTTQFADTVTGGTWHVVTGHAAISSSGLVTGVSMGLDTVLYIKSNGTCDDTAKKGIYVNPLPIATISSSSDSICFNSSATITFNGTPAAIVYFSVNGSASSVVLDGAGFADISTGSLTSVVTYNIDSVSSVSGCTRNITGQDAVITVITPGIWLGGTSTDWSDPANWSCGEVPDSSIQGLVLGGTVFAPVIGAGYTANCSNLYVGPGVLLTLADNSTVLNISGNVTNMGTIYDGDLILNGIAAQTVTGTGSITDLTINNTNGVHAVTIQPGAKVNLTGTLTLANGTLNTNGGLTLISTDGGTGRIGAITGGDIIGNVTCQQYIPGHRAMRHISHPFSTPIPLTAWADNFDITGHGGAANGFTPNGTDSPSAFYYDPFAGNSEPANIDSNYDPGWISFANINQACSPLEAIRVLIRGAKGIGVDGQPYTPSSIVYGVSGEINKGTVTIPMSVGASSAYNMIGNPYPSPVDVGTVVANAGPAVSGGLFWVWNTNSQTAGGYEGIAIGSPYTIESNSGFMVSAAFNGATLTFNETNKSEGGAQLFRTTNVSNLVSLHVYDSTGHSWDKLLMSFNNQSAATFDGKDAPKPGNSDLDFYSWSADGKRLNLDVRPYVSGEVIPLGLTTYTHQKLTMTVEDFNVPTGAELYLHDKYLHIYQQLQQGLQYQFAVTTDPASQGDARFELNMQGNVAAAVANVQGNNDDFQVTITPNPAIDIANISYTSATKEQTSLRVLSVAGMEVIKMELGITDKGTVKVPISKLPAGVYIVQFSSGSKSVTARLVKE